MNDCESLSQSQLIRLKTHLHKHLQSNDVYGQVKDAVHAFMEMNLKTEDDDDSFSEALQQTNMAQNLVQLLIQNSHFGDKMPYKGRSLHIKLLSGVNFSETVLEQDENKANFIMVVVFGSHRFSSYPIAAKSCPEFNQEFMIGLEQQPYLSNQISYHKILHLPEKLLLILLKEDPKSKFREIVSSQEVEWRGVLQSGSEEISVELCARGIDLLRLPVGTLNIQLQIVPRCENTKNNFCDRAVISKYVSDTWMEKKEVARKFQKYVKNWWNEFLLIRNDHQQRIIKLFAPNENNDNCFVCSMVQPIYDSRVILTPMHAARFVRMIPYVAEISVGGETTTLWTSLPVFLSRGHGGVEEHSALLCSLFLGFGLSAYICCGQNQDGPYTWVMTKESKTRVLFWDSVTGITYSGGESDDFEEQSLPFDTIGCVFNHQEYYANIQRDNGIRSTSWDLSNPALWKSIAPEMIRLTPKCNPVRILPCKINPITTSERLDMEIQQQMEEYRRHHLNSDTNWDDALSHGLIPALVAYEHQFITGSTSGNALFQQAIKNLIPVHYIFKAYPAQFDHADSRKIMAHFINETIPSEILNKTGASLTFAIRTYIVPYAEQIAVTWVMLAMKWRQ